MTMREKLKSCFKDTAIKSQLLHAATIKDGLLQLILEKTQCLLFGTASLVFQLEHF